MASGLRFGTAVREITPAYPVWLHGYTARDHMSCGVADPIYLGCLAVEGVQQRVLIVTCDLIGIPSHVCEGLYELLARETGVAYPHVLLACSHTHFAPALHASGFTSPQVGLQEPDPRFVADFRAKLVEAARESLRNARPARIEIARREAPQVLFNRRTVREDGRVRTSFLYPEDPGAYRFGSTDGELTAWRIADQGVVRAVLVHLSCHPVTGGEDREGAHYRISADYVGYLRRTVSEAYACPTFFVLGAAGDAVPIRRYGDSRQRIGGLLGNTVLLAERTYATDASTEVWADSLSMEAETIIWVEAGAAQDEYEQARARLVEMAKNPQVDHAGEAYRGAVAAFEAKMLALERSRLYPDNKYTIRVQFVKFGQTVLVGLPFEVLAEIGLRLKERFPEAALVSCAGGYQGYLPLAYEYERGGYEASEKSTHFVPGTADRLLEAIVERLEAL